MTVIAIVDIVDRLRDPRLSGLAGMRQEAADEIERLRTENERLEEALQRIVIARGALTSGQMP